MKGLMRFTEAVSLALHTAVLLARRPQESLTAREIAAALEVSENHLAKVLQRLVRAGLLESTRGPGGGFRLAADPETTRLMTIYEVIEGPFDMKRCLLDPGLCRGENCVLGEMLGNVNREVATFLRGRTLAELARSGEAPEARSAG